MTNTNINTNVSSTDSNTSSDFNFETKEQAVALYIDSQRGLNALLADLEEHREYQSTLCKSMLDKFGTVNETTGKRSLQLDLGDGSARGHIVVEREREGQEPLYFIRERNTGRPVGSKNRATKAKELGTVAPVAEETAEIVTEGEPVVAAQIAEANIKPTLTPMEQAIAVAEAEEAAAKSPSDPVVEAILAVQERTLDALKAHSSRSMAPTTATAGAAE